MKPNVINYLVCPKCKNDFTVKVLRKKKDEIFDGILTCKNRHKFKIKKGIPRLITDKTSGFIKTEEAFTSKWKIYFKNYQTKKWFDFTEKWFLDRFGWKNVSQFNDFLKTRNFILDAGTGVGNSAKRFSTNPHSQVFAIDASDSIEFAYQKYGNISNVHFIQADLLQLPFKRRFFDFICSDQVIHHTKNTKLAFKSLVKHLSLKGNISIYVYNKKGPIREYVDDHIRERTTKMSEKECLEFSENIALLGRALSKLKKKITIPKDIPLLKINAGTYDIQRFFYWNFVKCFWADDNDFHRSVGVNYDWYYPKFAWRHTPQEVKIWHKEEKIRITHFQEIESGISVTGKKIY